MLESLILWFVKGGAVVGLFYGLYRFRRDRYAIHSFAGAGLLYVLIWAAAGAIAGLVVWGFADSMQKLAASGCMPLLG